MRRKSKKQVGEADYAIVVEPLSEDDGGGWLASVPALAGGDRLEGGGRDGDADHG
jgi:hypothetical protein